MERNKFEKRTFRPPMSLLKKTVVLFFLSISLLFPKENKAQFDRVDNLPKYYNAPIHFGFFLGLNSTNFLMRTAPLTDSVKVVEAVPQIGFNLGIVAEAAVHDYFTWRFTPSLAFADRSLEYTFQGVQDTILREKKIESTFINFPINLKYRSMRWNNFAAYLLAGGSYSLDLASQKDTKTNANLADQIVKLNKHDIAWEVGSGLDFFLPYFKFGIELKMSVGIMNILIDDDTVFSNSLNSLRSKVFLISLTFEG